MTSLPKKSIRDIIAGKPMADRLNARPNESDDMYQGDMLYGGKGLVDRMKSAYKKRKREQKIDALRNSDTLWSGLQ